MRNRNMATAAIIIVVVLLAAGLLLAMRKSDNTKSAYTTPESSMDMPKEDTTPATENAPSSNQNTVEIKDYAYSPGTITVKAGTKVTWTNQDGVGHTVTADTPSSDAPDSKTFAKGESYSFTFNKAGTYTYHCAPHPYMKGTVIVTE